MKHAYLTSPHHATPELLSSPERLHKCKGCSCYVYRHHDADALFAFLRDGLCPRCLGHDDGTAHVDFDLIIVIQYRGMV